MKAQKFICSLLLQLTKENYYLTEDGAGMMLFDSFALKRPIPFCHPNIVTKQKNRASSQPLTFIFTYIPLITVRLTLSCRAPYKPGFPRAVLVCLLNASLFVWMYMNEHWKKKSQVFKIVGEVKKMSDSLLRVSWNFTQGKILYFYELFIHLGNLVCWHVFFCIHVDNVGETFFPAGC